MVTRARIATICLLFLVLCSGGTLLAAPMCQDVGPITLDMLMAGGRLESGCIIEDKLFDNFSYAPVASSGDVTLPQPSAILVTPLLTPFNPGLSFNAVWYAGAGAFVDATLGYRVTVQQGGNPIDDINLFMLAGQRGTGSASIDEGVCRGGFDRTGVCPPGNISDLHTVVSSNSMVWADHKVFGPVMTLDVRKDIGVRGGTEQAQITTFEQRFSEVPEPSTFLLIGAALMGLGIVRRRV